MIISINSHTQNFSVKNLLKAILIIPFLFCLTAHAQLPPNDFMGPDAAYCQNGGGGLGVSSNTPSYQFNSAWTYLWSTGETTQIINYTLPIAPNAYTLTIWCQVSLNGQSMTDTIHITGYPTPPIPVITNTAMGCVNSTTLSVVYDPTLTYQWSTYDMSNPGVFYPIPNQNGNALVVNESGSFKLKVTNQGGCTNAGFTDVTILGSPKKFLHDTAFCKTIGQPDLVLNDNLNSNCIYLWDQGSINSSFTINPNMAQSGINWVTITDVNSGCATVDSITWAVRALPLPLLIDSGYLCQGESITLKDSSNSNYGHTWYDNSGTISLGDSIVINTPNTYYLKTVDNYGCTAYDTVMVIASPMVHLEGFNFIPQLPNDPRNFYFEPLGVENADSYHWDFGDGSTSDLMTPFHLYTTTVDSALVSLTVSNDNFKTGCNTKTLSQVLSTIEVPTGINEIDKNSQVILYPNPAKDIVFIQCKNFINVQLLNINGVLLQTINNKQIDLSSYPNGFYILKIQTGDGTIIRKINKE